MDMMMQMLQTVQAAVSADSAQSRAAPDGSADMKTERLERSFCDLLREKQQAGRRPLEEDTAPRLEQALSGEMLSAGMAALLLAEMTPSAITAGSGGNPAGPLMMTLQNTVIPQVSAPQSPSAALMGTLASGPAAAPGIPLTTETPPADSLRAPGGMAEGTPSAGTAEAAIPQIQKGTSQTGAPGKWPRGGEAEGTGKQSRDLPEDVVTAGGGNLRPLFQQVNQMPVKVGDAPRLDTTSPEFDAKMADAVLDVLRRGDEAVELKLSPENLGSVTLLLSKGEGGALHVVLAAESERTLRLLEEHTAGLGALLQGTGQREVRVDVQHAQENPRQQQPWQQDSGRQNSEGGQGRRQDQGQRSGDGFLQQLRLGLLDLNGKE